VALTETDLRREISAHSEKPDGYMELANFLFENRRFEEAVATLRQGLTAPLGDVDRAIVLITLGWYINSITWDRDEPQALGEQALALTQGDEAPATLFVRAKAQALISDCAWRAEPVRARAIAESALSLFDRVLRTGSSLDPAALWESYFESARRNCGLGRFEEACKLAEQALRTASDRNQELNSLIELGAFQREAGRLEESRGTLTKAIRVPGAVPFALVRPYFELGQTEAAMGKAAEARAKLRRAIEILQSDPVLPQGYLPELLRITGDVSYDMGDIEEAARLFRAATEAYAITEWPYWTSLLWLAVCQVDLGELGPARINAERVVQSPLAADDQRKQARELLQEIVSTA
jgi:tetratricopeptide (TPR) repeat protein